MAVKKPFSTRRFFMKYFLYSKKIHMPDEAQIGLSRHKVSAKLSHWVVLFLGFSFQLIKEHGIQAKLRVFPDEHIFRSGVHPN